MRKKKPHEIKYSTVVYRDSKGRFAKLPSSGKLPKGWTKKKETRYKLSEIIAKKAIKKLESDDERFASQAKKAKVSKSYDKLKVQATRHIRFRRPGTKTWYPISPEFKPKKGVYYQTAIFSGNNLVGYWRTKTKKKWSNELVDNMNNELEAIRFPERKRFSFRLEGDTLKEALSFIRIEGLKYNCKVMLNIRLKGIRGESKEYKGHRLQNGISLNHDLAFTLDRTFGRSYDEIVSEKIYEYIRQWCLRINIRYTSHEVLEELYHDKTITLDTYQSKIERDWLTNVSGSIYGAIL